MKSLLLILGATGVGKTELSLRVAEHYGCPILNCDSRQVFRGIPVGTAAPTAEEQARVKHYFIATRELEDDYNAGQYERDALALSVSADGPAVCAVRCARHDGRFDALCRCGV